MYSRYKALLWEQSRVAGAVAGMCLLGGWMLQALFWALYSQKGLQAYEFQGLLAVAGALFSVMAALSLILRQDATGHLRASFEERLLRLPIQTFPLSFTLLTIRVFHIVALMLVFEGTAYLLAGASPGWWWRFAPAQCYLFLQVFAWAWRRIRGLTYVAIMAALGFLMWMRVSDEFFATDMGKLFSTSRQVQGGLEWVHTLALHAPKYIVSFPGVVLLFLSCIAVTFWSVRLIRRDEYAGPPDLDQVFSALAGREEVQGFATANDAMAWYVWRTGAWIMPLLTVGFSILFVAIKAIFISEVEELQLTAVFGPFAAFAVACLLGNMVTVSRYKSVKGDFPRRAPVSTLEIARAFACAHAKGIGLSLIIALAESALGIALFMRPFLLILIDSHAKGMVGLSGILLMATSPVAIFMALGMGCLGSNFLHRRADTHFSLWDVFREAPQTFLWVPIAIPLLLVHRRDLSDVFTVQYLSLLSIAIAHIGCFAYQQIRTVFRFGISVLYIPLFFGIWLGITLAIHRSAGVQPPLGTLPFACFLASVPLMSCIAIVACRKRRVSSSARKADVRGQHWWLVLYTSLAALAFIACAIGHVSGMLSKQQVAGKMGFASTCTQFAARFPAPSEENDATTHYRRAASLFQPRCDIALEETMPVLGKGKWPVYPAPLPVNVAAQCKQIIEEAAPAYAEIRTAATLPRGAWSICQAGAFIENNVIANMLNLYINYASVTGDAEKATEGFELLGAFIQSCNDGFVEYTGGTQLNYFLHYWGRSLSWLSYTPAQLDRIESALDAIHPLSTPLLAEREYIENSYWIRLEEQHEFMQWFMDVLWTWLSVEASTNLFAVNKLDRIRTIYSFPTREALVVFDGFKQEYFNASITSIRFYRETSFFWRVSEEFLREVRQKTYISMAHIAFALERYRLARSDYPDALEALVPKWLPTIPEDPFDNQPMRYIKMETGFTIYSVDKDGKDDGAITDTKGDVHDLIFEIPLKDCGCD